MATLSIQTPRIFLPMLKPARYKGLHGGRGSGKSHFFAEALIERCLMHSGTRWACIREVQKSLEQSVKRLLDDKIEALGVGHMFNSKQYEIETPGGGVIIFQGMQNHTADSIKSLEGFDGAWVEEAQSLSQRSLELLRPTIRKEYADGTTSELWFSWNPSLETDPVDVLLRGDSPPPDSVVIEVNYLDNPWFPNVLKAEMEYDRGRDPDKYAHVWLGEYQRNSEARVFKNWTVEEFDVDPNAIIRQGADWGFAVDPTVLVQSYIVGRKLYVPYEAYRVGCEIADTPALFMTIPDSEKWPIVADSARPETISHMQKNGFPKIMPAVKGPKSLEEGVEFLKTFDIIVHPRCKHTIDELTLYSYKIDPLTNLVMPVLNDKDNHVIDALRYACEGARRAIRKKPEREPMTRTLEYSLDASNSWMG
jgi:phage terminase large subunit